MVDIGTKEQWDAYLEGYRKFNQWEEEHWHEHVMPPEQALKWMSSAYKLLSPESHEWARKGRDWRGFSQLMKTLELLRV